MTFTINTVILGNLEVTATFKITGPDDYHLVDVVDFLGGDDLIFKDVFFRLNGQFLNIDDYLIQTCGEKIQSAYYDRIEDEKAAYASEKSDRMRGK